jgi:acyl carrier protein
MSNDTDVKQKIRDFIAETFLIGDEKDSFDNGDSFMATGIVDSTGVLEITVFLESEFEITIEDDEMTPSNLDSVNNLASFVMRKTG